MNIVKEINRKTWYSEDEGIQMLDKHLKETKKESKKPLLRVL